MKQKGFTLIEMLIVVAIIGSLTAIVVGALTTARGRAQDTKIKSNLGNMRSQAAIYFAENGDYGAEVNDDCDSGMFTDSVMVSVVSGVEEANGAIDAVCYTSDSRGGTSSDTWAVSAALKTDSGVSWCVDSDGKAIEGDAQIDSDSAVCQ